MTRTQNCLWNCFPVPSSVGLHLTVEYSMIRERVFLIVEREGNNAHTSELWRGKDVMNLVELYQLLG